jgi:hypothetical protein
MPDITREDLVNFWILTQKNPLLQKDFVSYLRHFSNTAQTTLLQEKLKQHLKNLEATDNLIVQDLKDDSRLLHLFLEDMDVSALIKETQNEALQQQAESPVIPPMRAGLGTTLDPDLVVQRHRQGHYETNIVDFITRIKNSLTTLDENSQNPTEINQSLNGVPGIQYLLRSLGVSIISALHTNQLTLTIINEKFTTTIDQLLLVRALRESAIEHIQKELHDPNKSVNNIITYLSILDLLSKSRLPKEYLLDTLESLQSEFGVLGVLIDSHLENSALALYLDLLEKLAQNETSALRVEKLLNQTNNTDKSLDGYLEEADNLELSRKLGHLREILEDKLPSDPNKLFVVDEEFYGTESDLEADPNPTSFSDETLAELAAFKEQNSALFNRGFFTSQPQSTKASRLASGFTTPQEEKEGPPSTPRAKK